MASIINGSSPTVTFSDGTTQATSAIVSGYVPYANLPAGSVLQVVQAVKTDTATTTSTTYTSLLSANITPKSTSSKILVVANISLGGYGSTPALRLNRGGTDILLSNTSGSKQRTTFGCHWSENAALVFPQYLQLPVAMTYLDSPATTSSTTYAVYWSEWNGNTTFCNRSYNNADANWNPNSTSTITLMEIAG
jgi:hypothetical protein